MMVDPSSDIICTLYLEEYGVTSSSTNVWASRSDSGGHEIFICNSDFMPDAKKIFDSLETYTWKSLARVLSVLTDGFIGEDALDKVVVNGESGLRADFLKLSWACEGSGLSYFLRWILNLEEETIDYLEANYSLGIKGDDTACLIEIVESLEDSAEKDFLILLDKYNLRNNPLALEKLLDKLDDLATAHAAETQEKRQKMLHPFEKLIVLESERFSDQRSRGGGIIGSSKRMVLKHWLEEYVIANGAMPEGTHEVITHFRNLGNISFSATDENQC